jgi:DNA-binding CsgD family transcriptional regulator
VKLFELDRAPAEPAMALAAGLMDAIGAPDLAQRLLQLTEGPLPASHCTVFALRDNGRVEAISSASTIGQVASLTAFEYMRLGFDRQDSNMRWLMRRRAGKRSQAWLAHQFAEEVADEAYRRLCYGDTGIRERLSLLAVFPTGSRVALSWYRNHSYPDYGAGDFDWLGRHAQLVVAAVRRHMQLALRAPADPHLADSVARLSARERELISHVLAGRTTKEAASAMGVSTTTALTYRYRAFRHLGVSSGRDLLARVGAEAMP